jgi:hypothetical protein
MQQIAPADRIQPETAHSALAQGGCIMRRMIDLRQFCTEITRKRHICMPFSPQDTVLPDLNKAN